MCDQNVVRLCVCVCVCVGIDTYGHYNDTWTLESFILKVHWYMSHIKSITIITLKRAVLNTDAVICYQYIEGLV